MFRFVKISSQNMVIVFFFVEEILETLKFLPIFAAAILHKTI